MKTGAKKYNPAREVKKDERALERLLFQRDSKEEEIAAIMLDIDEINEEIEQVRSNLQYWKKQAGQDDEGA